MTRGEKGINAKKAGMKIPFVSLIKRWLNTRNLFGIPSKDRYKSLKMSIVLLDTVILMIPLIIMATVSYLVKSIKGQPLSLDTLKSGGCSMTEGNECHKQKYW